MEGPAPAAVLSSGGNEDDSAAEDVARQAEVADLSRRVLVGAVLTVPVFIAVMAMELVDATWVPELLLEPWV